MPEVRVRQRVWLESDGQAVFGTGICQLLRGVEATGSLHRAASDLGIAYSKAWAIIGRAERSLGVKLLADRRAGGAEGGGSRVSEDGLWLVEEFSALADEAAASVEAQFALRVRDRLSARNAATPRSSAGPRRGRTLPR